MIVKKYVDEKCGGSNTYIVIERDSAIIIDAGVSADLFVDELVGLTVEGIFITHAHFDHIFYLEEYMQKFNTNLYICDAGYKKLYDCELNMSLWHYKNLQERGSKRPFAPIELNTKFDYIPLVADDEIWAGDIHVKAIYTPGHSSDSYTFIIDKYMFPGDLVFKKGVGRTDFYDGNNEELYASLFKLTSCKEVRVIHPGHGDSVGEDN